MSTINNNTIRQVILIAIILLIGGVLFWQLRFFLPAFLGAYTLYILCRKPMFILTGRYKWKKGLAAGLLMFFTFLIILLPVFLLVNMLGSKINFAIEHSAQVSTTLQNYLSQLQQQYGFDLISKENIAKLSTLGAQTLPKIIGATFDTITTIVVMYFILFFMLAEGRRMETALYKWLPLKEENVLVIKKDMNALVYSNAVGIPLIAIAQGIVGLIGYFILGVKEPWFWFVLTCITAMLPIVGAALAYVPVALLFFAEGASTKGIIMTLYGFLLIGSVDNIFRFWLQKRIGDTHPLVTVFGVIVGLNLFGFIGLIFGPILIALFLILVKVYAAEYADGDDIKPST
ncbi:MAG: AI-2E family transporter [Sphingobacteriales bacterium]|jgi:predicted PurR-regulated permease PerM|nr:MAG: AI-2E family transporter [Sphingobacteriales bacterium]